MQISEMSTQVAGNDHVLAGQFITFCRNVCPVNEQKVEIFICCSIAYFQPELPPNNEQKADKNARPAQLFANANVVCCPI
jgi:hypothetical protein